MKIKHYYINALNVEIKNYYDEKGNWIDFPDFKKTVWPLITTNSTCIKEVLFFNQDQERKLYKYYAEHLDLSNQVFPNFYSLGSFNSLSQDIIKYIHRYAKDDNFAIFFLTDDYNFIKKLVLLFPGIYRSIDNKGPVIDSVSKEYLNRFITGYVSNDYAFSFGDENNTLSLFGSSDFIDEFDTLMNKS